MINDITNVEVFNNFFYVYSFKRVFELENMCSYADPDSEWRIKNSLIKYEKEGNTRMMNYINKWDGRVKLYTMKDTLTDVEYKIPIGMLDSVITYLELAGEVVVQDNRFKKYKNKFNNDHIKTVIRYRNDEQRQATNIIRQQEGRGIVEATTGFGKTILALKTIQQLRQPTVIIADSSVIVDQWNEQIQTYFNLYRYNNGNLSIYTIEKHKSFTKAIRDTDNILLMVCTSSLLHHVFFKGTDKTHLRNGYIRSWLTHICDMVIYDEVHNAGAKTAINVLDELDVYSRLGFSATVFKRGDNRNLEYVGRIGSIIYTLLAKHIKEAKSIPLKFLSVRGRSYSRRTLYDEIVKEAVIYNQERNDKIIITADEMLDEGRRVLILINKIEHARLLNSISGFPYTWASDKDRKAKFKTFHSGDFPVFICTYDLVGEGYDYPELDTIILAGEGKGYTRYVQAVGRILREVEGKRVPKVFDFADNVDKLREQAIERLKIWVDEKIYDIDVRGTFLARYFR